MSGTDQRGFSFVGLLVAVVVVNVLAGVMVTKWSTMAQREREREAIWRGEQYAQALDCYRQKRGVSPRRLEELLETHCIRRLYTDPLSESGEWKVVRWRDLQDPEKEKQKERGSEAREPGGAFVRPGEADLGGSASREAGSSDFQRSSRSGLRRTAFRERLKRAREEWQRPEVSPGAVASEGPGVAQPGADPDGIAAVMTRARGEAMLSYEGQDRYQDWVFLAGPRTLPAGPWTFATTGDGDNEGDRPPGARGRGDRPQIEGGPGSGERLRRRSEGGEREGA